MTDTTPEVLTVKQRKALTVMAAETTRDPKGITPGRFGDLMYPDTQGHVNAAQGLAPHAARSQAAGSVLARLRKRGWVTVTDYYGYSLHRITAAGRDALASTYTHDGVRLDKAIKPRSSQ